MIITIDGPAGAGKSTVARRLAEELGFEFLDTGAMYRALAFAAMTAGTNLEDENALLEACRSAHLEFRLTTILLNGNDISQEIRTPEVSRNVKYVADHLDLRKLLVAKQRELAEQQNIVCEGRDQGTVAFPHADHKFFLTADSAERARRRVSELQQKGIAADFASIKQDQDARDEQDRTRPVGGLIQAEDAVEVCTDGLTIDEVVTKLKQLVEDRMAGQAGKSS